MRRIALAVPAFAAATWGAALLAQGVQGTMAPVTPPPVVAKSPPAVHSVNDAPPVADYTRPSSLDPRVCLEFATNEQIIACAERYRPHRRRA